MPLSDAALNTIGCFASGCVLDTCLFRMSHFGRPYSRCKDLGDGSIDFLLAILETIPASCAGRPGSAANYIKDFFNSDIFIFAEWFEIPDCVNIIVHLLKAVHSPANSRRIEANFRFRGTASF